MDYKNKAINCVKDTVLLEQKDNLKNAVVI